MIVRMVVGLVLTVAAFAVAGRRLWWLKRLAFSGQPAPERLEYARTHPGREAETQLTEVIGQRKLLKWTVPGMAHAATFWGFIVLLLTIIEAYGALFSRTFAIPGIGHWAVIGFLEDLFAVGVLCGISTFTVIRLRNDPHKEGRGSRFFGSHTRAAWVVLGMIAAGHHHAAALPGRAAEHRRVPLPARLGVRVLGGGADPAPAGLRGQQRP